MAASLLCNQVILFLVERYTEDGEGNGTPLHYSCLENPMDRGAWWATVHGVAKSWARLSDLTLLYYTEEVFPVTQAR